MILTSNIRGVFVIDRTDNKKPLTTRISRSTEEFRLIVTELKSRYCSDENIRLYASVNSRDTKKAARLFSNKKLNADFGSAQDFNDFYFNLEKRWMRCLFTPSSRETKYFLIDIDTTDIETVYAIDSLIPKKSIECYETYKGFHIIAEPFNPSLLKDIKDVEIKKDGLFLIQ